jgi:hypothetical protein
MRPPGLSQRSTPRSACGMVPQSHCDDGLTLFRFSLTGLPRSDQRPRQSRLRHRTIVVLQDDAVKCGIRGGPACGGAPNVLVAGLMASDRRSTRCGPRTIVGIVGIVDEAAKVMTVNGLGADDTPNRYRRVSSVYRRSARNDVPGVAKSTSKASRATCRGRRIPRTPLCTVDNLD